jgi:hypothetical protein
MNARTGPDGLLMYYHELAKRGVPVADIDQMTRISPAKLLGLQT